MDRARKRSNQQSERRIAHDHLRIRNTAEGVPDKGSYPAVSASNKAKGEGMKITIEVNMDNAAFSDNPEEVRRILRVAGNYAADMDYEAIFPLHDSNGNKVGKVQVTE